VDGIDDFKGREFEWAVSTVIENAHLTGLFNQGLKTDRLVEPAWQFILENFSSVDVAPPDYAALVSEVQARVERLLEDWKC
jgi:hypothetical protein